MGFDHNTTPDRPERRPPAVLQIVPRLVSGGAERGTVELAAALVTAGWRAYVASAGGPLETEIGRAGAEHCVLPLASKNPLVMRRNAIALAELIRRRGIDIVHARSRAPAWSAWAAARATGCRFVTTFHNVYGGRGALKRRYNSIMARGERVIAISDFVAGHAKRVHCVGPDRLRTIARGVDLDLFDPQRIEADRIAALTREWQLPEGLRVAILPGRLTRWKGGLDFIAALAVLGRVDLCGVLVGAEQRRGFRRELEAAAARAGLGARLRIVAPCHDMAAAYCLADVVVSASREPEGFGRVIAEAQAMGRPIVATDHGGARETVLPGTTGWLAPPRHPAALAAAIGEALSLGSEERAVLGRRAREHIAAHFTTKAMCEHTIAVYRELLPQYGTQPREPAPAVLPA